MCTQIRECSLSYPPCVPAACPPKEERAPFCRQEDEKASNEEDRVNPLVSRVPLLTSLSTTGAMGPYLRDCAKLMRSVDQSKHYQEVPLPPSLSLLVPAFLSLFLSLFSLLSLSLLFFSVLSLSI